MRSRSCWTCRGTSRHNLHNFLVGDWRCHDGRWYPTAFYTGFRFVLEYTPPMWLVASPSVRKLYPSVGGGTRLWNDWGYVMVRNGVSLPGGLDDGPCARGPPFAVGQQGIFIGALMFPRQSQQGYKGRTHRSRSSLLFAPLSFRSPPSFSLTFSSFFYR